MCDLLPYESQIFLDLHQNDGLLIMAEGLGIERLFLNFIKLFCDPSHLVMIVNTNEAEEKYYVSKLKEDNVEHLPIKITNETHSIAERQAAYMKGGCYFITSRILVVDLLTDRIPIDLINGIIVSKAHFIVDNCQETFILRLFRQKNKKGFIKAFSDDPVYFVKNMCKVDRIMKNLFVKKLFIYPRFHADIQDTLDKHMLEVIEIHVQLSEYANSTQMALLDIINVLLQELKGCCTYIDPDYLSVENAISKPFNQILKLQLEPVWNQVGSKPKQLINDIKTLRLLLYYLTQYDCVTFYKMLTCLKSHEKEMGRSSGWIFLDAAHHLFTNARLRVYGDKMSDKILIKNDKQKLIFNKENKELAARIVDESPKLKALKEVLAEISEDNDLPSSGDGCLNVLITANDDRSCIQLRQFLNNNEMISRVSSLPKDLENMADEVNMNENKEENADDIEKEDEFIEKMILKNNIELEDDTDADGDTNRIRKNMRKKRKLRGTKEGGSVTLTQMMSKKSKRQFATAKDNSQSEESDKEDDASTKEQSKTTINMYLSALQGSTKQRISLIRLVNDLKPKYVVLYDIDLRFVRQLEVYKVINPNEPMRIYFLMYKNSCEEQRYLTAIRSEKEAFELLIKEKAAMIVSEEQDGKLEALKDDENEEKMTIAMKISSRKGGEALNTITNQQADEQQTPCVIVDMREFRSELPSLLHKRGIHVEPITIEVGDYILTPDICVERKSINDLIESLSNGRLYNQANAMCRSYKIAILLIEFDQNKPFVLNTNITWSNEISAQSVASKLVLLTIHFPKLRIIWSPGPRDTAEIFEELKSGCAQPNAEQAHSVKNDHLNSDIAEHKYNPILRDLLLKIPGINMKNVFRLMNNVKNLLELCEMSEERLGEILENTKAAKQALEFLSRGKSAMDSIEDDYEQVVSKKTLAKTTTSSTSSSDKGSSLIKLKKNTKSSKQK